MKIYSLAFAVGAVIAEENLVRVKRQNFAFSRPGVGSDNPNSWFDDNSDSGVVSDESNENDDGFQCVFRDLYGFEWDWEDFDNYDDCQAEKSVVFEAECETDCQEEDSIYSCDSEGITACVNAQFLAGRSTGRKLGMKYGRWKSAARMIAHIVAKPTLKKKEVIKKMLNYGCHCFPGGKKTRTVGGKGPAMDEIDNVCRTQYQCHKCVEMDKGCDPDNTPYKAQFKGRKGALKREVVCKDPEDSCARDMCECDKRMAENLGKVWFQPGAHNLYYWNERRNTKKNPTFSYTDTCLVPGNSPQPDACCGQFPDVVPYNIASKGCCVQEFGPKLFDPMTHTCCAGGLVATAGSC